MDQVHKRLTADISKILPYLNAALRGAIYHAAAQALTCRVGAARKKGGHNIAFHAYEIATSNVEDREGAEKELKGLIDLLLLCPQIICFAKETGRLPAVV